MTHQAIWKPALDRTQLTKIRDPENNAESFWAEPLDDGHYRVANVLPSAYCSLGDVVRTEPGPDIPHVTEVVRRTGAVGLAIIVGDENLDLDERDSEMVSAIASAASDRGAAVEFGGRAVLCLVPPGHLPHADDHRFVDEINEWVLDTNHEALKRTSRRVRGGRSRTLTPILMFTPEDGLGTHAEIDARRRAAVKRRIDEERRMTG